MNGHTRSFRSTTPFGCSARSRAVGAILLPGLLVGATGCAGYEDASPEAASTHADEASTSTTPLDPCELIPAAMLDTLAGGHAEQHGLAFNEARGRACRWHLPGGGLGPAELVVTAWHGQEFYLPGSVGDDVAGIGDEAQADRSLGVVLFRSNDEVVSTHVLSFPDKNLAFDVAEVIAKGL